MYRNTTETKKATTTRKTRPCRNDSFCRILYATIYSQNYVDACKTKYTPLHPRIKFNPAINTLTEMKKEQQQQQQKRFFNHSGRI